MKSQDIEQIEAILSRDYNEASECVPLRELIRTLRSDLPFTCNMSDIKQVVD